MADPEPAGCSMFYQSIAAYKLFVEGKDTEKTPRHLAVRLAIEERRLEQWGEGSGFCSTGDSDKKRESLRIDSRLLQNEVLCGVVTRTLACIKDLLNDVDLLTKKYGLQVWEVSTENAEDTYKTTPAGGLKGTEKDLLHISETSTSRIVQFRWAVREKDGFEKFLGQLQSYNDNLYSLHSREIGIAITRDVLASLIASASDDALIRFRSLRRKDKATNGTGEIGLCRAISSAASVALKIRRCSVKDGATLVIPRGQISRDAGASSLATWRRSAEDESRVFLETKEGVRAEEDWRSSNVYENLRLLASLLSRVTTAQEFRAMRCLGISFLKHDDVTMIYELPPTAHPMTGLVTLYELLKMREHTSWAPTLDDRFELAKAVAGAVFQMHSAGWMHEDISSHNILFFQSMVESEEEGPYCLRSPYLKGFRFSRRVRVALSNGNSTWEGRDAFMRNNRSRNNERENTKLLRESIYQHPSYLFHKLISEAGCGDTSPLELRAYRDITGKTYYTCRHEYYSLGLLLLEIGLWRPLDAMDLLWKPIAPKGFWDIPLSLSLTYRYGLWETRDLTGRMATALETMRVSRSKLNGIRYCDDNGTTWTAELDDYIQSLRQAMTEEQITGIVLEPPNTATIRDRESFWSLWDEVYPYVLLRKDAVIQAKESLGLLMGRRYKDVVLRCLNGEFSIEPYSSELTWLRAFNWLAVKELEKCCA